MNEPDDQPLRRRLRGREAQVHDELHRLDPRLADLFLQGHEYLQRMYEPASVHMLSHAGREISNAIIRILTGEGGPITPEDGEDSDECSDRKARDSQRRRIAKVLELSEQHPSVRTWLKAHNTLQGTTHFGAKSPSPERVEESVRAFRALTEILFGRIGLYFEARREVDDLLQVETPTGDQVQRLQTLVARPQLRHAFFRELRHIGWLDPLLEAGLFEEPPDVRTDPDTQEQTAPPWPEAIYLERMAPDAPDKVVEILQGISEKISNPIVWRGVADTVLRLPPKYAARTVPKLRAALEQTTHPMVSRGVFSVAQMLASAENGEALNLLRSFLRVVPTENSGPLATSPSGQSAALPNMRHTARPEEFRALVEAIARVRATATVAELTRILNEMLEIELGKPPEEATSESDDSQYWHGDITDEEDRSAKSLVASAILRAALIASETDEAGDAYVFKRLSRYPWQVFERLRLGFLATRPVFDQEALDEAIGDKSLLSAPHLLPEYRQLLVARIADASSGVRSSIVDAILKGPTREEMERFLGDDQDPDTVRSFRENWQRHRLRVFGDDPPSELREIATQLGIIGESLTKSERDLDQSGFAVEVGVGGGPTSPLSSEEIRDMSAESLIEYLTAWTPKRGRHAPSPTGLASVIAGRIEDDQEWAANFLTDARAAGLDGTYLRGALDGLASALKSIRVIPWSEALQFIEWLVAQPEEPAATEPAAEYFDYRDPGLKWARKVAAGLLRDAASDDLIPDEHRDELWSSVEALARSEATWISSDDAPSNMEGVLHLELNTVSGKAAGTLLSVALNDYRRWKRTGSEPGEWPNRTRLRPLLDDILSKSGTAGIAARSALGRYLSQVLLIDEEWVKNNHERIFAGAIVAPFRNPAFASHVVLNRPYGRTLEILRPLYEGAVATSADLDNPWTSGDRNFRPGRHLLSHLVLSYRHQLLSFPADEDLLDAAFTHANPDDSAHTWWQIFRYWSDYDEVPPTDVERVRGLMEWRIERLEEDNRDESQRRQEAKGLAWLAMTDRIPDDRLLPLLLRAVRLSRGEVPVSGELWNRLARMTAVDVAQALETGVLLIEAELRGEYPHFNYAVLEPVLRIGLASGDPNTRDRSERVIHTLGDHGFEEFGQLLQESEDQGEAPESQ